MVFVFLTSDLSVLFVSVHVAVSFQCGGVCEERGITAVVFLTCSRCFPSASPSGKKFRSKPQLARYLGNQMDLSSFDFRTGKMLMSKLNKNRQRLRYDNNNQNKVSVSGPWR